jgi:hypothetical protein
MYRSCIFCSADLRRNEAIEEFPVGSRLAFDAWKGRLWAVCTRCTRWNLAPIEERWEAVESAERLFRDARVRVQSENIGLAKLPDGTHLIRVGEALPLEVAAWRYGDQSVRRQRRFWLGASTSIVAASALMIGGLPLFAAASAPALALGWGVQIAANFWLLRSQFRVIHRVPAGSSPTGEELVVRQPLAMMSKLVPSDTELGFAVEFPAPLPPQREESGSVVRWVPAPPVRLEGDDAERMMERTLVSANARFFGGRRVREAVERLDGAGGPLPLLRELAKKEAGVFPRWLAGQQSSNVTSIAEFKGGLERFVGTFKGERIVGSGIRGPTRMLARPEALALEMALHQETERRALEGELKLLEVAWREADEIAAIADTLPDDPLDRIKR